MSQLTEFQLIEKYFTHHASNRTDVILGVGDDCAILQPPADQRLVMTTDSLIENIHFFPQTQPNDLGFKSLAVSLSDIAAMGAEPAWVLLSLTLPEARESWLQEFCAGFYQLLDHFNLGLVGGNTTRGPLSITTQVTGFLAASEGLLRQGARPGDLIYITGTLGDAGVGLDILKKKIKMPEPFKTEMLSRLNRPQPRVKEGMTLRTIATAAIDISDGLMIDLSHLLTASGVGATINPGKLPLSKALRTVLKKEQAWQYALNSGDDYELCFTIPPGLQSQFELTFGSYDCGYICVGKIEPEPGLRIIDSQGEVFNVKSSGYQHF